MAIAPNSDDGKSKDRPLDGASIAGKRATMPTLWGVIVTYRRPHSLRSILARIKEQTFPPDHLIVIDNGSDPYARQAAMAAGAEYIDSGDNLGPAGGIAIGMEHVLASADPSDWLILFDDDDPPHRNDLLEELWGFALECSAHDSTTGCVGLAPIFRLPIVSRCDALRISIWGGFLQLGTTIGPVVARAGRDFHISG